MTTSMNERTHFFIKKIYLSHFIFERVDVGCVWEVSWRRGQTATYWPKVLLTIAAILSYLGWGCSTVGHWGPKVLCLPLALISASFTQLTPTASGTWLYNFLTPHQLPLFFCLFTQVHLLIDSSVEGQYVTHKIIMKNKIDIKPKINFVVIC